MEDKLKWFVLFFCLLFAGSTLLFGDGSFSIGLLLGSAFWAAIIAAIIKTR